MAIKRSMEELETSIAIANYLVLLSRGSGSYNNEAQVGSGRVFECRTCNKQFPSFQALGGHRASHKKSKLSVDVDQTTMSGDRSGTTKENLILGKHVKVHECSICGMEFGLGQALGGHMRRHREALTLSLGDSKSKLQNVKRFKSSSARNGDGFRQDDDQNKFVCLDLSLALF